MPVLSTRHSRRNRALNGFAWLTLAGLLVLVAGTFPATAAKPKNDSCKPQAAKDAETRGDQNNYFQVSKKRFHFAFGEHRTARSQTIKVEAYLATPKNLTATVYEFVDPEGISVGGFETSVGLVHAGDLSHPALIDVCILLDPARIADLHAGRYEGTLVLRADNYRQDASIPISATFRAPRDEGKKMAVAGVLIGLIVKTLTELGSARRSKRRVRGLDALRAYFLQWSFPLAIILGVLAGWLGFLEMYESNDTWGVGDGTDSLKLFATCFAFQMGSIGSADMTKRLMG
jgi:hypothetical protein